MFRFFSQIGDIISVIDMPPPSESFWWRGKLTIGRRDLRITIGDQPPSPLFEVLQIFFTAIVFFYVFVRIFFPGWIFSFGLRSVVWQSCANFTSRSARRYLRKTRYGLCFLLEIFFVLRTTNDFFSQFFNEEES